MKAAAWILTFVGTFFLTGSLALAAAAKSGGTSSTQTNPPSSNANPSKSSGNQQSTSTNSVLVQVNGSVASVSENYTYNLDGTLAYQASLPTASGYRYVQQMNSGGQATPYYQEQRLVTAADGSTSYVATGVSYKQVTPAGSTTPEYIQLEPSIAMNSFTTGDFTGTATPQQVTADSNGTHTASQLPGGIFNSDLNKSDYIESLVSVAKASHDTFIDLSTTQNFTQPDAQKFGTGPTPSDPSAPLINKVVYARGSVNANGSVTENNLKFGGGFVGHGLLVVEINDPADMSVIFDGSAMWSGLIVVIANKPPLTANTKAPFQTTGGGNNVNIVGGVVVYVRNPDPAMIGTDLASLSGTQSIMPSPAATQGALTVVPSTMKVRSWRKVPESEQ
jgi:hypothetical protein